MTEMKAFYDNSQNLFNQHLDENLIVPIHKQYAEDLTSSFLIVAFITFNMYRVNKTSLKGFFRKFKEYTSRGMQYNETKEFLGLKRKLLQNSLMNQVWIMTL